LDQINAADHYRSITFCSVMQLLLLCKSHLCFVSFLVGKGAEQWAISHGIPACPTEKMTTSECQTTHTLLSAALTAVFLLDLNVIIIQIRTCLWITEYCD